MRALLVYPTFPRTYWGQEYTHALTKKGAVLPPLGLITSAALLPREWELRLVDMNIEDLTDEAIAWADVVMLSAMRIQRESFHEVVRRAHDLGKRVVAGGPYVTTDPESASDVDHLVLGEAEDTLPDFARKLEKGDAPRRVEASERPDVRRSPIPRYDLLRIDRYNALGVQFSRGCPFNCEFCDIIEIFGRVPRTKMPEQLLAELDAAHATGFRGAVFVVDDNFIGNKVAARKMLTRLAEWSKRRRFPFDFFTEVSVNLADDDKLLKGLVEAGFSSVFVGIETPSREALFETQKVQNTHLDLSEAIDKIVRAGLQVMAGFIVGFDADDEETFERQHDFIASSPIPMALIGILTALPGTQLWRRLAREGRLYGDAVGDTAYRPNFVTTLPEPTLVKGYGRLLARLYEPRAYFSRAFRNLTMQRDVPLSAYRRPLRSGLPILFRSLWKQGVRSSYRLEYWRFLIKSMLKAPHHFKRAIALAVVAEHMIRYTQEDVLPRLAMPRAERPRVPLPPTQEETLVALRPRPERKPAVGSVALA